MRIVIPLKIIELESDNYHIMIQSIMKDGNLLNWIIDTGASRSVFDKNLKNYYSEQHDKSDEIHSAGIGEKPLEVSIAEIDEMRIGKLTVKNQKVALLDLSHINKLYSKTADIEISGLLGGDFLTRNKARIDYKKGNITLYPLKT